MKDIPSDGVPSLYLDNIEIKLSIIISTHSDFIKCYGNENRLFRTLPGQSSTNTRLVKMSKDSFFNNDVKVVNQNRENF